MDILDTVWGRGEQLTVLQMSSRALVTFFITLILIRVGGMRIFGKKSAFDSIVVIMMGAVLARGVVGASPYWSTVAAAVVMIAIHRILGWTAVKSHQADNVLKGKSLVLYESGAIIWENMKTASLSREDLLQSLRMETQQESLAIVEKAYMETNGRISFITRHT
jgi:uncharacterized membrane protein YcaP (DUF421 family)